MGAPASTSTLTSAPSTAATSSRFLASASSVRAHAPPLQRQQERSQKRNRGEASMSLRTMPTCMAIVSPLSIHQ